MNKDQVKGKVKDVAGRIERQAGEWTGDEKKEVHGTMKQAEARFRTPGAMSKTPAKRQPTKPRLRPRAPSEVRRSTMRILRPLVAGRADRYLEVCGQGGESSGIVTEIPALPQHVA
jgi:uncharacterized protein YjbJ (UPF0337 family)